MHCRTIYEDPHGSDRVIMGARFQIGRFVRRAAHEAWRQDNQIGPWPLLVFPSRAVEIAQAGRRIVVANPNVAMFYNPGTPYRRGLLDPRGDLCHYVALEVPVWKDLLAHHDEEYFRYPRGPVRPELKLEFDLLLARLEAGHADELAVEETLLSLAGVLVADASAHQGRVRPRGPVEERHVEAVHALEQVLSLRFREALTLEQLADTVGLSPYHAARLFRRFTGCTLHGYRDRLRLCASLPELAGPGRLDAVALELGYASHSHFTDRFRRIFGWSPSAVRERLAQPCGTGRARS
jgi:AraC family transcriptional regulator